MTHFDEEAIAKAKQAKSVEELLTLAKESGVEMTAEQAQEYYTQLNLKSGELADDELDNVAGGGGALKYEYRENSIPRKLDYTL